MHTIIVNNVQFKKVIFVKLILFFFFPLLIFFSGCGKKKVANKKLGEDYYKISNFELEGSLGSGSYRKSLIYINKAIEQDFRPEYLAKKATLLFLLGEVENSKVCFEKLLKLPMRSSVRSEVLNNYACLVAKSGDVSTALSILDSLEEDKGYLTPEVALVNKAKIYYDNKNFYKAKSSLLKAVRFADDYVDAYYYLSLVYLALGEKQDAYWAAKKTVKLEPDHVGAISLIRGLRKKL